jgi:hypothetical protein
MRADARVDPSAILETWALVGTGRWVGASCREGGRELQTERTSAYLCFTTRPTTVHSLS